MDNAEAAVVAILAREVPCGQDGKEVEMRGRSSCVAYVTYGRRCPECLIHVSDRADIAREIVLAVRMMDLEE